MSDEKEGGGRVGRNDHEDRYTIQNTLRYVGGHSAWVYILRLAPMTGARLVRK